MAEKTSREGQELRAHRLWAGTADMMARGTRDPEMVASVLQAIKDGKKFRFGEKASEVASVDVHNQSVLWQTFLHEALGIKLDFANCYVPNKPEGFNWPIIVPEGMSAEKIIAKMRKHMKVWVWDEKELKKITSVRESKKTYAVWVRDRVEADEELQNKSADDLKAEGVNCITLLERLMLEFFYWWRTKQHLDINNWTLCAGSRGSDGRVPRVTWDPGGGGVDVYWDYSDDRYSYLRSRQAVS